MHHDGYADSTSSATAGGLHVQQRVPYKPSPACTCLETSICLSVVAKAIDQQTHFNLSPFVRKCFALIICG